MYVSSDTYIFLLNENNETSDIERELWIYEKHYICKISTFSFHISLLTFRAPCYSIPLEERSGSSKKLRKNDLHQTVNVNSFQEENREWGKIILKIGKKEEQELGLKY